MRPLRSHFFMQISLKFTKPVEKKPLPILARKNYILSLWLVNFL